MIIFLFHDTPCHNVQSPMKACIHLRYRARSDSPVNSGMIPIGRRKRSDQSRKQEAIPSIQSYQEECLIRQETKSQCPVQSHSCHQGTKTRSDHPSTWFKKNFQISQRTRSSYKARPSDHIRKNP